ncbi:MAG: hypothetical protein ACI8XX_000927 [Polaribacter sp.]|jgi:hypothetical protein
MDGSLSYISAGQSNASRLHDIVARPNHHRYLTSLINIHSY